MAMRRVALLAAVGMAAVVGEGFAGTYRVDPVGGSDSNDGQAWIDDGLGGGPLLTVQAAIDKAFADDGGEVWLLKGTHAPSSTRTLPGLGSGYAVELKSRVKVHGGFSGTEDALADRGTYSARETVIDGSTANAGSPAFHVVGANQTIGAAIEGVTITGGQLGTTGLERFGAGLVLRYCDATTTVRNCWVVGNTVGGDGYGAGLWLSGTSATVEDCLFAGNDGTGGNGGGAMVDDGGSPSILPVFRRCAFAGNRAGRAAGVYVEGSTDSPVRFESCIFAGNEAELPGGAFFVNGATVECVNSLFVGNRASNGASASVDDGSRLRLFNCTVADNSAPNCAGVIVQPAGPIQPHELTFRNVLFSGNANYALVEHTPEVDIAEVSNCLFHASTPGDMINDAVVVTGAAAINAEPDGIFDGNVDGDPLFVGGATGQWESRTIDGVVATFTDNAPNPAPFVPGALKGMLLRPNTASNIPHILVVVGNTADSVTVVAVANTLTQMPGTGTYQFKDYHIAAGSAAQDAGLDISAAAPAALFDFDGKPRAMGPRFDIGAYEIEGKLGTEVTVTSAPNPSMVGAGVQVVADIGHNPSEDPTGTVDFFSNGGFLSTATVSGGQATILTPELAIGANDLTAEYSGDATFLGSTSPASQHTVLEGADLLTVH